MKIWMVFLQSDDDTWLEAAWDDESTASHPQGWKTTVDRARGLAHENDYEMRILEVEVPGVFKAFDIPAVTATLVDG